MSRRTAAAALLAAVLAGVVVAAPEPVQELKTSELGTPITDAIFNPEELAKLASSDEAYDLYYKATTERHHKSGGGDKHAKHAKPAPHPLWPKICIQGLPLDSPIPLADLEAGTIESYEFEYTFGCCVLPYEDGIYDPHPTVIGSCDVTLTPQNGGGNIGRAALSSTTNKLPVDASASCHIDGVMAHRCVPFGKFGGGEGLLFDIEGGHLFQVAVGMTRPGSPEYYTTKYGMYPYVLTASSAALAAKAAARATAASAASADARAAQKVETASAKPAAAAKAAAAAPAMGGGSPSGPPHHMNGYDWTIEDMHTSKGWMHKDKYGNEYYSSDGVNQYFPADHSGDMMRASAIVLLGNITNVKQCGHKMTHCAACPGVGGGKIELVLELADPADNCTLISPEIPEVDGRASGLDECESEGPVPMTKLSQGKLKILKTPTDGHYSAEYYGYAAGGPSSYYSGGPTGPSYPDPADTPAVVEPYPPAPTGKHHGKRHGKHGYAKHADGPDGDDSAYGDEQA